MFSRIRRPSLMCLRCRKPVYRNSTSNLWEHTDDKSPCKRILPDPKVLAQYPETKDGLSLFNVPLRMRSATNPGGIGHVWVRDRFINPETKRANSVFIPASLDDNPSLDQATYRKNLEHLNAVDRERLMAGDWDVMEEGAYFQRHWFTFVREVPAGMKWCRYWDLAATADGDWTAGCLLGLSNDGEWYIADVRRIRATPKQVEQFIRGTAEEDGRAVPIRMEQEPGSSGVMAIDTYRRRVLVGFDFRADKKVGSKEVRANPVSSAAEAGMVHILAGRWNRDFLDEAALFPNGAHDDQIDALTGAFSYLASRRARIIS
jgi:predicted phage terminase large subunit-like protein